MGGADSLTSDNLQLSRPKNTEALVGFSGDRDISSSVRKYLGEAISENTKRAYRSDLDHFLSWGGSIPATDVLVAEYLAGQAAALAPSTLSRRLASIAKAHAAKGLSSPTTSELVRSTLRGIKRAHKQPQRRVKPLLIEDLLQIMQTLGTGPHFLHCKSYESGLATNEIRIPDRQRVCAV